ncbi:HlyD family efflux transporter periplasmic adaptor subunit [Roseomonas sp. JC162]|uniref:HlyD family efflux transporter periplasmic adaptor subunit n=1 Tax=Neoroseomonas marina TaxID=1232220 RepID=A0A848E8J2_9PROT|nr:HlyD family efflux transporter periplasmic adaptor subunit [Neoroseomonas marina]
MRRPFHMLAMLLASLTVLAATGRFAPVAAHEGHDHGAASSPPAAAAPRTETHSDLFEVVAILAPDGRLRIHLDRFPTAEPVPGATIALTVDGDPADVAADGSYSHVARHPALTQAGRRNLLFTVTAGAEMDLLPATLELPAPAAAGVATPAAPEWRAVARNPLAWTAGLLLLLLGAAIGRVTAPRQLPPQAVSNPLPGAGDIVRSLRPDRAAARTTALAALLLLPVLAQAQPIDAPRRQPDGSVFVPKPTQHLLGLRAVAAERSEAAVSLQLVGQVIADPNASGRVQSAEASRIEAPEDGFPVIGQQVARGQRLAYAVPVIAAQDRAGVRASIADIEAQIVITEARLRRLTAIASTVAAREISDARAELEGLRQRRAANLPAVVGREPILAPASGVISVVRVAAGQVVDAREPLFDIVDPARLWVEAIAFDPAAVTEIAGATAVTASGQALRLAFVGRGLALRQQALPLQFRLEEVPAGLVVGQPVTVSVQTPRRLAGIVLPAEAVVRSAEGPPIVFEMPGAERFVPRPVRVQPLDGRRVLVTAGLEPGMRVVTEAAGLVSQVR